MLGELPVSVGNLMKNGEGWNVVQAPVKTLIKTIVSYVDFIQVLGFTLSCT